jgi:hypothetical protein
LKVFHRGKHQICGKTQQTERKEPPEEHQSQIVCENRIQESPYRNQRQGKERGHNKRPFQIFRVYARLSVPQRRRTLEDRRAQKIAYGKKGQRRYQVISRHDENRYR